MLDSTPDANLFICSGVILNKHLGFKLGVEKLLVLVHDLTISMHVSLAALKWEED